MLRSLDLIRVYRLLGECRDLGSDGRAWRIHLLEGMRALLGGYVGVAGEIHGFLAGRPAGLHLFSLGWMDKKAARRWDAFIEEGPPESDPTLSPLMAALRTGDALTTKTRQELVTDQRWYRSPHYNEYRRPCGVDHCLHSYLRVPDNGGDVVHVLELHRAELDRGFCQRDVALLDFLHNELALLLGRQLASFTEPSACDLSPRQKQVLEYLLRGDAEKQVARRLGLAPATVHEYVEAIYRHFRVGSRGELMARWIRPTMGGAGGKEG